LHCRPPDLTAAKPQTHPCDRLSQIVVASLAGGVLATVAAAGTLALHASWISRLVSFRGGALLGRCSSNCCRTRCPRAARSG
jgi:hypothetical protein